MYSKMPYFFLKLKDLKLPKHWMSEFFYAYAEMELHMNEEALSRYQKLSCEGFENSTYIKSQIATALYNLRGCSCYCLNLY